MDYKNTKAPPHRKVLLLRGCLILLAVLLACAGLYAGLDPYHCRIVPDVQVDGIDVGGMSIPEAYRTLKTTSKKVLEGNTLWVDFPESTVPLDPQNTKVSLNCRSAVLAAWAVGRFGNQSADIGLEPHLKLDKNYIREQIDLYADLYDTDLTAPSTRMAGPDPDLQIENQSAGNKPQTLELTMGLPTTRLDREDAFRQILSVYDSAFAAAEAGKYRVFNCFRVDVLEKPEKPDLQAIYNDVYIAPVDDSLDMKRYEMIRGAYGYHFNIEKAEKMTGSAQYGETLSIPMEFQEPEIFEDDVYFRDILGSCDTKHTNDEDRNHNLTLACQSMNGVVLQPGEVFSYNDTLGQRTKENGYRQAGAYSGWELVKSYGGGICQGSSTLYCATLYADLEIVQRKNHGFKVGYLDAGLDATVNWGGPDFQFRNNTHFPIKIAAEVSDGYVRVKILGTEERDYYIEMETEANWGKSTISAKSFKCKYDRETKALISRELEARSNYMR